MARFTIIYNENGTVSRILEFMGNIFIYEWNRASMIAPDFRAQAVSKFPDLNGTHIPAILDNISYYNDDLPNMIGTISDFENAKKEAGGVVRVEVPP